MQNNTDSSSSSVKSNVPQSYDDRTGVERNNFWSRHDSLMNMYNNMMDHMERFNTEMNRAFSENFGDNFFTPRNIFSRFPSLSSRTLPAASIQDNQVRERNNRNNRAGEGAIDVFSNLPEERSIMDDFISRRPFGKLDEFMNWGGFGGKFRPISCIPRVDMTDEPNQYLVHADLPGMRREDIKLNVQNGRMNISGGRHEEKKDEGKDYVFQERCNTEFYRSFTLPKNIKEDQIKANFNENGTLSVTIPKNEASASNGKRPINIE